MTCPSFLSDIPGAFVLIIVSDDATSSGWTDVQSSMAHGRHVVVGVPSADFCNLHSGRLMIYDTVVKVQKGVRGEPKRYGTNCCQTLAGFIDSQVNWIAPKETVDGDFELGAVRDEVDRVVSAMHSAKRCGIKRKERKIQVERERDGWYINEDGHGSAFMYGWLKRTDLDAYHPAPQRLMRTHEATPTSLYISYLLSPISDLLKLSRVREIVGIFNDNEKTPKSPTE